MSESEPPKKPIMPSVVASGLFLAVGRDRALRIADQGSAALERDHEERWKVSTDLWLTVDKRLPAIGDELFSRLGVGKDQALGEFLAADWREEPAAERNKLGLKHPELDDRPIMSQVLKDAMRSARQWARDNGEDRWRVGPFLAATLDHPDSLATSVLKRLGASDDAFSSVVDWLREVPDPPSEGMSIDGMKNDMQDLMYKLIPTIRRDQEEKRAGKPTLRSLYEQSPEKYAEQPDLVAELQKPVPDQKFEWATRSGVIRRAARWQALSRKAPEVTLAHLLLALLVEGTDTSRFIDDRGLDRMGLLEMLEPLAPRFEEGPLFPEESPPFALTNADKPHFPRRFSDLEYLHALLAHNRDPSVRLLGELGVEPDDVKFRLRVIWSGDPEWHLKKPDLAVLLQRDADKPVWTGGLRSGYILNAAEYEARIRGADGIEAEHVLIALLVEGTDTTALFRANRVDPGAFSKRLDATLPRKPIGRMFPERQIGAIGTGTAALGKEPFSDLLVLAEMLKWADMDVRGNKLDWVSMLAEVGITPEVVDAAIPPMRDLLEEYAERRKARDQAQSEPGSD